MEETKKRCGESGGLMCSGVSEALTQGAEISSLRYLPPEGPRNSRPSSNFSFVWIII